MIDETIYLLPPEVWRHVCNLVDEPVDTTRPPAEVLAQAATEHPEGHDCPKCIAYAAARGN